MKFLLFSSQLIRDNCSNPASFTLSALTSIFDQCVGSIAPDCVWSPLGSICESSSASSYIQKNNMIKFDGNRYKANVSSLTLSSTLIFLILSVFSRVKSRAHLKTTKQTKKMKQSTQSLIAIFSGKFWNITDYCPICHMSISFSIHQPKLPNTSTVYEVYVGCNLV
jgi:hypothetical protein